MKTPCFINHFSNIGKTILGLLVLSCGIGILGLMDLALSLTEKGFFSKTATLIASIALVTLTILFLMVIAYALLKEGVPALRLFLQFFKRWDRKERFSFRLGICLAALPFVAFPVTHELALTKMTAIPFLLFPSMKALYLATDPNIFTWERSEIVCAVLIILCVPPGSLLALKPFFFFDKQTPGRATGSALE